MSKYSPKIDLVFRKSFGSEENKDLLLSLLNGILDCQPRLTNLTSVTINNPHNFTCIIDVRASILDIKAIDEHGASYNQL